jgi:hypothetical protein
MGYPKDFLGSTANADGDDATVLREQILRWRQHMRRRDRIAALAHEEGGPEEGARIKQVTLAVHRGKR